MYLDGRIDTTIVDIHGHRYEDKKSNSIWINIDRLSYISTNIIHKWDSGFKKLGILVLF